MEVDMLHAAGSALLIILDWHRLGFLFAGVCMGLSLGLLPGIGGVAGTALLLRLGAGAAGRGAGRATGAAAA